MAHTSIPPHYKLPAERPFTAEERAQVTILFGTLTWFHDSFIEAVFRGSGYQCEKLPIPTKRVQDTGKEFCNNGLCNPNYFTAGNLIEYLRNLEQQGLSRSEIVDRYVYYTAGGCGPCRYGMYEAEYRQALANAGYAGFRVITFDSNQVIQKGSDQPGLKYSVDFGVGMFVTLLVADLLFELGYSIRPYEIHAGETDRVLAGCVHEIAEFLRTRGMFEFDQDAWWWLADLAREMPRTRRSLGILGKVRHHLYAREFVALLDDVRLRLDAIEVDHTRLKPRVKITGEFFSALAESEANYGMFRFLEREGAEVAVDTISGLVLYWLHQARINNARRRGVTAGAADYWKKELLFRCCIGFWTWQYHRIARLLGGTAHHLVPQGELARLAEPWFDPHTRGGEGHLEVAKTLYYSLHRHCHMVLSLKPFGCMPSTQSDGVMAGVIAKHPEVLFLAVETSGEGEANAHSRVQMALGDARRRARAELETALAAVGRTLEEVREYAAEHRELRRAFLDFPRPEGITGRAAQFVLYVGELMNRRRA